MLQRAMTILLGKLLDLSELGRKLRIAVNTAKRWPSIQGVGCHVVVLRPYLAAQLSFRVTEGRVSNRDYLYGGTDMVAA